MQYRQLGNSGLIVSRLCLGTMIFGEESTRGTGEKDSINMIRSFLDAGGNFIDTADVYAGGKSEEVVGRALDNADRSRSVVATKVRAPLSEDPNDQGLSRKHIVDGVEKSLRRLGTDYIDLLYAHMWDPVTPVSETLRAFDELVSAGKVRYIGVSNFAAWQVMKALAISDVERYVRFVAAQYQHSLVMRDIEPEFVELFRSEGIGEIPWGGLGGGFLSGKYSAGDKPSHGRLSMMPDHAEEGWQRRNTEQNWEVLRVVEEIAKEVESSIPQVALSWLLTQPQVTSILLGVRTPDQLEDNMGAINTVLDTSQLERLDSASDTELPYPYRMIRKRGSRVMD